MDAIPLIRARYLQAFAAAVDQSGVRSLRLFEALKIPETVIENPDTLHPAHYLWAFAGHAARITGRADLGLAAGRSKLEDHGLFGARVSASLTLHHALGTFCTDALKEYSRAFFWIERRGETTWFCREKIDGERDERSQIELYLVELMLQSIRMVTGPQWRPSELWLQTEDGSELRDTDTLSQLKVSFGCLILAIPVPRILMTQTLPRNLRRGAQSDGRAAVPEPPPPATDFVESLRQMLQGCLSSGQPGIGTVAEAAGTSVRTLQRRLRTAGVSYSGLVDEVRMVTALPLLEDRGVAVTDIAFDLGYSDPAHFTRAFRRWAGVSPTEYRAHQQQA